MKILPMKRLNSISHVETHTKTLGLRGTKIRNVTKTGNGEWGMGNGEWEIEKWEIVVSVIITEKLECAHHRKHSANSL